MNPDPAPRKAAAPFLVPAPIGGLLIAAIWWVTRPGPLLIRGEVAAPRVDMSDRPSGRVAQIRADLDEFPIYAPMPGTILARVIEQGQNVGPGTPRFTIVDLDQARFSVNLREDQLAGLLIVLPVLYGLPIPGNASLLLALGLSFFFLSG